MAYKFRSDKNAYHRAYYAKNREKLRSYYNAWTRENRNAKGFSSTRMYKRMALSLLRARDRDICGICGLPITNEADFSIDHIILIANGGSDDAENIRLAHMACNMARPKRKKESE